MIARRALIGLLGGAAVPWPPALIPHSLLKALVKGAKVVAV